MSQYYIVSSGGTPPPVDDVVKSINNVPPTELGVLFIRSESSFDYEEDGIAIFNEAVGNQVFVQLTNRQRAKLDTTDDSLTKLLIKNNQTIGKVYEGTVTASFGNDAAVWFFKVGTKSVVSSTSIIGTPIVSSSKDPSLASADVSFSSNADDLEIIVKGLPSETVRWSVFVEYNNALEFL